MPAGAGQVGPPKHRALAVVQVVQDNKVDVQARGPERVFCREHVLPSVRLLDKIQTFQISCQLTNAAVRKTTLHLITDRQAIISPSSIAFEKQRT